MNTGVPTSVQETNPTAPHVSSPFPALLLSPGPCAAVLLLNPPGDPSGHPRVAGASRAPAPGALPAPWRGHGTEPGAAAEPHRARRQRQAAGLPRPAGFQPGKPSWRCPSCPAHGAQPGAAHPPPAMPVPGTAPPRRRLLLQAELPATPSCPVPPHGRRLPAPRAGWESAWRLPGTPAPSPASTGIGGAAALPDVLRAGMSSGHIWRLCIPGCCPAVQLQPARMSSAPERTPPQEAGEGAGGGCAGSARLCLFDTGDAHTHTHSCTCPLAAGGSALATQRGTAVSPGPHTLFSVSGCCPGRCQPTQGCWD